MKNIKVTKKQLKREIEILKSQNLHSLIEAFNNIGKCSKEKYTGSGITITIKNINKENFVICDEFFITDGLSKDTIDSIKRDIKDTYNLKMSLIPNIKE